MIKLWLSLMLIYILVFTAAPVLAGSRSDKQAESVEKIRTRIERLGIGEKARVTIKMKDGTKLKGYIDQTRSDDFVLKNRNMGAPVNIAYSDVAKVESNGGHSMAKTIAIGAAVGVGALLALVGIGLSMAD